MFKFRNPFKKKHREYQLSEPKIIVRRYEPLNALIKPYSEGTSLELEPMAYTEKAYSASDILEMERQIEELKAKSTKWDMVQWAIDTKTRFIATTTVTLHLSGFDMGRLEKAYNDAHNPKNNFQEAVIRADKDRVKL